MARQGASWAAAAGVAKAIGRLPPRLRVVAATAAVLAVFAVALGILGWMKPVAERTTTTGTDQSLTFSYSATVPRSPAYDTTTVTSPDPIFRKLTNRVDLHMRYAGPPGTFDVSAVLTNNAGWHADIPLASAKRFSNKTLDTSVSLDLSALESRANAAAAAIGIEPAGLTVTVNAKISGTGVSTFTAPLAFNLAPLQLALAAGPGSLVVTNNATRTPSTVVVREIGAFGLTIMTAARARGLAILLLFLAAAAAAAVAFLANRRTPLRTRREIERRFPQLLVHVEPMTSPPGKPVVNVDNFPALVKLAERYGQMILTWSRPDADDFVVRDEGITYRYRIPLGEPMALHNVEQMTRPSTGSHRRKDEAVSS